MVAVFLDQVLDQLREAARLLTDKHPFGARLCLVLADNVAELALHDASAKALAYDAHCASKCGKALRWSEKQRQEVLGQRFKPKLAFCVKELKLVDTDSDWVLRIGHELRNEAYHRGILHTPIIGAVAAVHLAAVRQAVGVLGRRWQITRRVQDTEARLNTYGLPHNSISQQDLHDALLRLTPVKPVPLCRLAEVLRDDILKRLDEVDDCLRKLTDGYKRELDGEECDRVLRRVSKGLRQGVSIKSLRKWKQTADRLRLHRRPGTMLEAWRNLDRQISALLEALWFEVYTFFGEAGPGADGDHAAWAGM